jgi:hypothetical protein
MVQRNPWLLALSTEAVEDFRNTATAVALSMGNVSACFALINPSKFVIHFTGL